MTPLIVCSIRPNCPCTYIPHNLRSLMISLPLLMFWDKICVNKFLWLALTPTNNNSELSRLTTTGLSPFTSNPNWLTCDIKLSQWTGLAIRNMQSMILSLRGKLWFACVDVLSGSEKKFDLILLLSTRKIREPNSFLSNRRFKEIY